MEAPVRFGIVGGGWRAGFFLRVAHALPERFAVAGMMVRDAAKGRRLEEKWGVETHRTLDELLQKRMRFVVLSVPWSVAPILIQELAGGGVPVLTETPPAPDLEGLIHLHDLTRRGSRVQVAEQYPFQPLHAARLALASSGRLGTATQAQVSAAHGYHGAALIRGFLGVGFENATVTARRFVSPVVKGPDHQGPPASEVVLSPTQTIAHLDFGDRLGVHDFDPEQYFSWVRSTRLLVRGERGEINGTTVRYLEDFRMPVTLDLLRQDAGHGGNLEGFYHKGIPAGSEWVYRNPFAPAALSDDEIAVATCLEKMALYADGGPGFYGLPGASQDQYLALTLESSAASGETMTTSTQPWANG
ncbi:MAG: Gfo/Idh/MocA family protein [Rubrobacter sp.]